MNDAENFIKDLLVVMQAAEPQVFERGEFILQAGAIEHHLYWIEEGAIRAFYLTELEEFTIRFGYTGSLINSISSFFKQAPSDLYLQAIRKTRIRAVSRSDFEAFVGEDKERLRQYNRLLQELIVQNMEREIDLLIYSPVERLRRVMERSPRLFQEVPAKYIAAYLRMSPETLSRIQKS